MKSAIGLGREPPGRQLYLFADFTIVITDTLCHAVGESLSGGLTRLVDLRADLPNAIPDRLLDVRTEAV
jgi:hypothetical protein